MPKPSARTSNDRSTAKNSAIEQAALGTTAAAMALGILASESDPARAKAHANGEQRHEPAGDAHATAPAVVVEPAGPPAPPIAHEAAPADREVPQAQTAVAPDGMDFGADHHGEAPSPTAADPMHASLAQAEAAPTSTPLETSAASAAQPATESVSGPSGPLTPAVDASAFQVDMSGLHSSVSDLGVSITSMVNAALDAALAVPSMAAGQLVDAVFQATPLAAAETPLIDATPLVSGLSLPAPLTLGFMGQPQQEGEAVHDGAFSALGMHHV